MIKRIFIFLLILSILAPSVSYAQGETPQLIVSPNIENIKLSPGQKSILNISLRTTANTTVSLNVNSNNFSPAKDGSDIPNYFSSKTGEDSSYYPASWFSYPKTILVPANKSVIVPIRVIVPENADPGGHYGGVTFTYSSHAEQNTPVLLNPSIAVPVLFDIAGNIHESLSLKSFSVSTSTIYSLLSTCFNVSNCKDNVSSTFYNNGNLHEAPQGVIEVYDMFGQKVLTQSFNEDRSFDLPGSTRIYNTPLSLNKISPLKFGSYSVKLSGVYSGHFFSKSSTGFFIVNLFYPLLLLVISIAIFAFFFIIRKHKKTPELKKVN